RCLSNRAWLLRPRLSICLPRTYASCWECFPSRRQGEPVWRIQEVASPHPSRVKTLRSEAAHRAGCPEPVPYRRQPVAKHLKKLCPWEYLEPCLEQYLEAASQRRRLPLLNRILFWKCPRSIWWHD